MIEGDIEKKKGERERRVREGQRKTERVTEIDKIRHRDSDRETER